MFDKNKVKLGIAPIAWTNDDLPDLGAENHLNSVSVKWHLQDLQGQKQEINIQKDPAELKKALDLRGIENFVISGFSSFLITKPLEEVEKEFRSTVRVLKSNGSKSDRSF